MYLPTGFSGPQMKRIHLNMDSWVPFSTMSGQVDYILLGYPRGLEQSSQGYIRDKTAFGGNYILQRPLSQPHKNLGMITIADTYVMFYMSDAVLLSFSFFLSSFLPSFLPFFLSFFLLSFFLSIFLSFLSLSSFFSSLFSSLPSFLPSLLPTHYLCI